MVGIKRSGSATLTGAVILTKINADAGVDRVERWCTIAHGVPLRLVDNLLGVVEQERTKQDQTPVDGNTVETCAKKPVPRVKYSQNFWLSCCLRTEHGNIVNKIRKTFKML
jgi:hypothetical protein